MNFMPLMLTASTLWIIASLALGLLLLPLRHNLAQARFDLFEVGRWVAFPYLALLIGHLSPRLMGMTDQNWQTTFGIGLGICFGLLVLVSIAKVTNSSPPASQHSSAPMQSQAISPYTESPEASTFSIGRFLWIIVQAFTHEFHWTFLRAGIWEAILQLEATVAVPAYTAIWSAGALAFMEIIFNRRGQTQWIWQLTTLLLTSVLFFYTRNFYLCALLHAGVALIMPDAKIVAHSSITDRTDAKGWV